MICIEKDDYLDYQYAKNDCYKFVKIVTIYKNIKYGDQQI